MGVKVSAAVLEDDDSFHSEVLETGRCPVSAQIEAVDAGGPAVDGAL
jgi:hypothetical protein